MNLGSIYHYAQPIIGLTGFWVCYSIGKDKGFKQGVRFGEARVRAVFTYEAMKQINNPTIQSIYERASRQ
jgi:hypothetical protein